MSLDPGPRPPAIPISDGLMRDLLAAVRRQYRLSWDGVHGVSHWGRVLENGLRLAPVTGADPEVVALFALFHDACRRNDSFDPDHGSRGARLAHSLVGSHFDGRRHHLHRLLDACAGHTDGETHADATVATCWDADRLDLLRVGISPAPHKLCTAAARDPAVLAWANHRARCGYVPRFVRVSWLRPGSA